MMDYLLAEEAMVVMTKNTLMKPPAPRPNGHSTSQVLSTNNLLYLLRLLPYS